MGCGRGGRDGVCWDGGGGWGLVEMFRAKRSVVEAEVGDGRRRRRM